MGLSGNQFFFVIGDHHETLQPALGRIQQLFHQIKVIELSQLSENRLKEILDHICLIDSSAIASHERIKEALYTHSFRLAVAIDKHLNADREVQLLESGFDVVLSTQDPAHLIQARIKAANQTARKGMHLMNSASHRLQFGDLVIDSFLREAWLKEQPIELTGAEFDLLWLLSSHAGEIMSREEIFHQLRGIEYDGQDRSVDVRVSRIRPKVGDDPDHPKRIKTIRSKGYLFVPHLDAGIARH